mgnify:CR=1 FL=1
MSRFFAPPEAKPLLPKEKIDKVYKSMRFKVFMGSFLGYAAYYLVRKNLSLASADMIAEGLIDKQGVGIAASAVSIAYAFSKFGMGMLSDRSDARKFLTVGLVIASLVMMSVGFLPFSATNMALNVAMLFVIMLFVGVLSGMGWPPCGRVMSHWFSTNERSFKMSIWNTAHNIGNGSLGFIIPAGIAIFAALGIEQTWRAAFIAPALVALLFAAMCWWFIRDTPESCGLPAIEKYRNDYSGAKAKKGEETKIPFKTLFVDYIPAHPIDDTMMPFVLTVTFENGQVYQRSFIQEIPIRRNWLTTLKGDLFTIGSEITLIIEETFDNEHVENIVNP